MISRIVRYILTLLCIAVAAAVVLNRGGYNSLIPADLNLFERFKSSKDSLEVLQVDSLLLDSLQLDSLQRDSLQRDSLQCDSLQVSEPQIDSLEQ